MYKYIFACPYDVHSEWGSNFESPMHAERLASAIKIETPDTIQRLAALASEYTPHE